MRWWAWLGVLAMAAAAGCGRPSVPVSPTAAAAASPTPSPLPPPPQVAGVPRDVPLMPGAYDVQVQKAGTLVVYRVKALLGEVLKYYQETLPHYGWQQTAAQDTVVGYAAKMARAKPGGDRVVLSLRYDVHGHFVTVAVSIARP